MTLEINNFAKIITNVDNIFFHWRKGYTESMHARSDTPWIKRLVKSN